MEKRVAHRRPFRKPRPGMESTASNDVGARRGACADRLSSRRPLNEQIRADRHANAARRARAVFAGLRLQARGFLLVANQDDRKTYPTTCQITTAMPRKRSILVPSEGRDVYKILQF